MIIFHLRLEGLLKLYYITELIFKLDAFYQFIVYVCCLDEFGCPFSLLCLMVLESQASLLDLEDSIL